MERSIFAPSTVSNHQNLRVKTARPLSATAGLQGRSKGEFTEAVYAMCSPSQRTDLPRSGESKAKRPQSAFARKKALLSDKAKEREAQLFRVYTSGVSSLMKLSKGVKPASSKSHRTERESYSASRPKEEENFAMQQTTHTRPINFPNRLLRAPESLSTAIERSLLCYNAPKRGKPVASPKFVSLATTPPSQSTRTSMEHKDGTCQSVNVQLRMAQEQQRELSPSDRFEWALRALKEMDDCHRRAVGHNASCEPPPSSDGDTEISSKEYFSHSRLSRGKDMAANDANQQEAAKLALSKMNRSKKKRNRKKIWERLFLGIDLKTFRQRSIELQRLHRSSPSRRNDCALPMSRVEYGDNIDTIDELDGIHRGKEANRAIRGRQVAHLDKMKQHQAQTKMKLEEQQLKDKIIVQKARQLVLKKLKTNIREKQPRGNILSTKRNVQNKESNRTFCIIGKNDSLRRALQLRGWREVLPSRSNEATLLWTVHTRNIKFDALQSYQKINHFSRIECLTTKSGLSWRLKELRWSESVDHLSFYPRSYDLSSPSDLSEFTKDFFFSACRSLLLFVESWHKLLLKRMQRAPDVKQKWGSVVRAEDAEYRFLKALRLALAMMEYYVRDNDGEILDDKFPSDDEALCLYEIVSAFTSPNFEDEGRISRWSVLPSPRDINTIKHRLRLRDEILDELMPFLDRIAEVRSAYDNTPTIQPEIEGWRNIWVLKPNSASKGIGVRLINHPSLIKATEGRIAQKYIEAPYLFEGFKIDLRQWVLVTAYEPLEIWVFREPLVRVAQRSFDIGSLSDKARHLCNYTIQKHVSAKQNISGSVRQAMNTAKECLNTEEAFGVNDEESIVILDDPHCCCLPEAIQTCKAFQEYVDREIGLGTFSRLKQEMHQIVIDTLKSGRGEVVPRSGSFEVLGFDMALDSELKPWLLEVNLSPGLHSTSSIEPLVKEMTEGIIELALSRPSTGEISCPFAFQAGLDLSGDLESLSSGDDETENDQIERKFQVDGRERDFISDRNENQADKSAESTGTGIVHGWKLVHRGQTGTFYEKHQAVSVAIRPPGNTLRKEQDEERFRQDIRPRSGRSSSLMLSGVTMKKADMVLHEKSIKRAEVVERQATTAATLIAAVVRRVLAQMDSRSNRSGKDVQLFGQGKDARLPATEVQDAAVALSADSVVLAHSTEGQMKDEGRNLSLGSPRAEVSSVSSLHPPKRVRPPSLIVSFEDCPLHEKQLSTSIGSDSNEGTHDEAPQLCRSPEHTGVKKRVRNQLSTSNESILRESLLDSLIEKTMKCAFGND